MQGQAEQLSMSRKKFLATTYQDFFSALYNSYLARRKRKRIGAVVKRRDGDGNGGFMDSRLLDRDKIQIALLFCSVVAIRSSFNRFGDRSVNSFCCRSRSCHFRRGRSRCVAEM